MKKTPIYKNIYNDFLQKINNGELAPGDRLPTEKELQEYYGVSRSPVRYSLDLLETQGYIRRTPGRGTEVLHPQIAPWANLSGFSHYYNLHADKLLIKTLAVDTVPVDDEISEYFGCNSTDMVLRISRLRIIDGRPIALIHNYFAHAIGLDVPVIGTENQTLLQLVKSILNRDEVNVQEDLSAEKASSEVAKFLNIPEDSPVLYVTRRGLDEDSTPVEFTRYWAVTDLMKYRTIFSTKNK